MASLDFSTLVLEYGSHYEDEGAYCLLEAAAVLAGERWSDHPASVSPVIASFGRRLNDDLNDADRQQLAPLLPEIVGTATTPADEAIRRVMLADWLIRVCAPAWLEAVDLPLDAGLGEDAAALRALPPLTAAAGFPGVEARIVRRAREAAEAARETAEECNGGSSDLAATEEIFRDAAFAVRESGCDAAVAALGVPSATVGQTLAQAVLYAAEAAEAAAFVVAAIAAGLGPDGDSYDAEETQAALRPTVEALQASALDLLHRLCAVGRG